MTTRGSIKTYSSQLMHSYHHLPFPVPKGPKYHFAKIGYVEYRCEANFAQMQYSTVRETES